MLLLSYRTSCMKTGYKQREWALMKNMKNTAKTEKTDDKEALIKNIQ